MTATAALTTDLARQVLQLEDDLRGRVENDPTVKGRWTMEHDQAVRRGRTASSWVAWRDDRVTQAAVAWVLTTVFVRFCEDNGLVGPVWIAGPEGRRQEALDAQLAYFRQHPEDTDREWLQDANAHLAGMPATSALVESHSALHLVSPSGNAATELLSFWRQRGDDGTLVHDLADRSLSTRFLGDLYQNLSAHAKATFALLQTPVFVEEFILDRTLEPALVDRPLEGFRLIDPTCGSGHFLLGAFDRLLERWNRAAPGLELQARVQQALDAIHGVDLNPFAVAIARFRLTVAAMAASGLRSLEYAPDFRLHLAVGDSLLHGPSQLDLELGNTYDTDAAVSGFGYATEHLAMLRQLLRPGRYDCVVANPPYIGVTDHALNDAYRRRYPHVCKGGYSLTAPFMSRLFELARPETPAGWVGQITSKAFTKRQFGIPVIEELLSQLDLRLIVDSEGAWIPGHNADGTPTVIIVGRNQSAQSGSLVAVLGKERRETSSHGRDGQGPYWSAIREHYADVGFDNEWVSVIDLDREHLATHPWSLQGGGAIDVSIRIRKTGMGRRLVKSPWGFSVVTREDAAYALGEGALRRAGVPATSVRQLGEGPALRDWLLTDAAMCIWPYSKGDLRTRELGDGEKRLLWPLRAILSRRTAYGNSQLDRGLNWYEYSMYFRDNDRAQFRIVFAKIASHNHAVLDRNGLLYKDSCYLLAFATETNQVLGILAVLNSSTVAFLLRSRSQPKGGAADAAWSRTYEYSARTLESIESPVSLPCAAGRLLNDLAAQAAVHTPAALCLNSVPTAVLLSETRGRAEAVRAQMIAAQEELDWEVYYLYGLIPDDLARASKDVPGLALGQRAFEIDLARKMATGVDDKSWFANHGSTPVTDLPSHWPAGYRDLVKRRLELIAHDPAIQILEKPEYKRRWATDAWREQETAALRGWLLNQLENRRIWFDAQERPTPQSIAQLSDAISRDADLVSVLTLWEGRPDVPVTRSLVKLLKDEAVPYLAAYRYKDAGLRKREAWEQTWALQRREDAGVQVGTIPAPPKYSSADFGKASYWHARGKLDVPKERFVLYPEAGRETDPTPLLGWAGWDHAQQSLALSLVIRAREADGWDDQRLVPLVAGLAELQPWVEQWHSKVDPTYGVSLAAFCREQLTARASQVGRSLDELGAWRPPPATRGRRTKRS